MPAAIDYCTLAPDAIGQHVISACCQAHDAAYPIARTFAEKLTADAALGRCIARFDGLQMDVIGFVYLVATATAGTLFWLRARWRRSRQRATISPPHCHLDPPGHRAGLFFACNPEPAMNRKAFYDTVRPTLGALTTGQVAGFERYLEEGDRRKTPLDRLAYIIATVFWETARTMQPVKEAYWKNEAWRKANLRYFPWYGRGDVQLTWEANYLKAGKAIGVDLIKDPDAALDPANAVRIAFEGMEQGWFTGKDLGDYLDGVDEGADEDLREFANARRIVNGTDKQIEIGKLALAFENGLRAAGFSAASVSAPAVPIPLPRAAEPAPPAQAGPQLAPAPIGHNGGPVLEPEPRPANPSPTPVEQASKAVGAGKWTAIVGTVWAAISAFLIATPAVPETYRDPTLLAGFGALLTTIASVVGAYIAPANAEQAKSP